jgi:virginiamycin B lyase
VTTITDVEGSYRFPELEGAGYQLEARRLGYGAARRNLDMGSGSRGDFEVDFKLSPVADFVAEVPASMFLTRLPDGETKRQFILDCTGCHQFDLKIAGKDGHPKSRDDWVARTDQMLMFAGAQSNFPIMSAGRDSEATADWLTRHLGGAADPLPTFEPPEPLGDADVVIWEYDIPVPVDLPHDLMVAPDGSVIVTGMFTHQMYVLDPKTGEFATEPIPIPNANPRALDIDGDGNWWVLLGAPLMMARFGVESEEWESWDLGMYPHSVMLDPSGRIWFNGHFSVDPELIGVLDPSTGSVTSFEVPAKPMPGGASTIPYGLRVAANGVVWCTELAGNRLIRFDPEGERFRTYEMPTTHSGPRRLDIGPDGIVWIPEYAANKLARFDPETEAFEEFEFPVPGALPYVARVDQRRGTVWVGTSGADVIARFDPITRRFAAYRLPTKGALIRHIDIDEKTGDVWGAYSPSPSVAQGVFRISLRD